VPDTRDCESILEEPKIPKVVEVEAERSSRNPDLGEPVGRPFSSICRWGAPQTSYHLELADRIRGRDTSVDAEHRPARVTPGLRIPAGSQGRPVHVAEACPPSHGFRGQDAGAHPGLRGTVFCRRRWPKGFLRFGIFLGGPLGGPRALVLGSGSD